MKKQDYIIIADYSENSALTLTELCEVCHLTANDIQLFVEYEIVHPQGSVATEWVFNVAQLQRLQTALRLQRDLEVNMAGLAMLLDLIEERDQLLAKMELLEKHLLR